MDLLLGEARCGISWFAGVVLFLLPARYGELPECLQAVGYLRPMRAFTVH